MKEILRQHTDRFGSNDVYQVNLLPQTITLRINQTDNVQNNPAIVSSADDDCGSGQTSGMTTRAPHGASIWSGRCVSVQNKNMLTSDASFAYEQEEAVGGESIKAPSEEYLLPEAAAASTSQRRQPLTATSTTIRTTDKPFKFQCHP